MSDILVKKDIEIQPGFDLGLLNAGQVLLPTEPLLMSSVAFNCQGSLSSVAFNLSGKSYESLGSI